MSEETDRVRAFLTPEQSALVEDDAIVEALRMTDAAGRSGDLRFAARVICVALGKGMMP